MGHYPWINRNYVKAAMLIMSCDGVTREDRWAAALTGAWIRAFHRACIKRKHPYRVTFHKKAHQERYIAQCATYAAYDDYPLYVPGFAHNLAILSANMGIRGSRLHRIRRAAVAVAAHEVRHRVQMVLPGVRLFRPNSSGGEDLILHVMMLLAAKTIADRKACMREAGRKPEVIKLTTNDNELDATIVEYLVHQGYPLQKAFEDLAQLLFTEPPRKP